MTGPFHRHPPPPTRAGWCNGLGETVEQARDRAAEDVIEALFARAGRSVPASDRRLQQAYALPEPGGSISLPDGSEIVVEATTYEELYDRIGQPAITYRHPVERPAAILAAANAYFDTAAQQTGR